MSATSRVPTDTVRRIVELATRAPSVHNTQPWLWTAHGRLLELRADRRRQLLVVDPTGRDLTVSCGAALHQAEAAAAALGWSATVTRIPDPTDPDLLARMELTPAPPPANAAETLRIIDARCTDRRRFTSWPVPDERLAQLARIATQAGTRAIALTDVSERFRAERLVLQATERHRSNDAMMAEQQVWRDRSPVDGVPSSVVPSRTPGSAPGDRFSDGDLEDMGDRPVEGSDGLVVVFDTRDEPAAWLRAGEGLSAMWLAASAGGLSVVPLSQVVEVPELRDAFQLQVLGGLAYPLILARIGWQAIGRSELARTPRRPVDDVLRIA
jgi:hypothetical protein